MIKTYHTAFSERARANSRMRRTTSGANPTNEIRVTFGVVAKLLASLPLFSLTACVLLSIALHWDDVTATHCHVPNYLPSLSAAVGDKSPERYVWRIGIALHCFMRLVIPYMYYIYYTNAPVSTGVTNYLAFTGCTLNFIENWCLILMTYVSSKDNYLAHELGFIGFISTSMIYMLISCVILQRFSLSQPDKYKRSHIWKKRLLICYVSVFLLSMYFFWRHNAYCEPGVYSLFALCEYMIVILNISFHTTAVMDFPHLHFTIGPLVQADAANRWD